MFAEFKIQQLKRIRQYHRRVGTRLLTETIPLSAQMAVHTERVPFEDLECLTFAPVDLGTTWGKGSDRAWFRIEGRLPANWSREEAVLWLDTNTEVLVRDHNGGIQHGLVSGGAFDDTSWKMARPLMHLDKRIHADGTFLLWAEAACMTHPGSETLNQPAEGDFEKAGFPFGVLNRCCLGRFNAVAGRFHKLRSLTAKPQSRGRRKSGESNERLQSGKSHSML